MDNITPEMLRKRFWEATGEKEKLDASTADMRADRERMQEQVAPLEAEIRRLNGAIRNIEAPRRSDLDNELSMIARALGGQVGERP